MATMKSVSGISVCIACVVTCIASSSSAGEAPRINGPTIYGVRPGSPIIYRLPVSGSRPIQLSAKGLPPGVTFDEGKGILRGSTTARGTNIIEFAARNPAGAASKSFRLVVGDLIALTPPLGFNTFGGLGGGPMMNETNVRKSFRALVEKGLVDHGYAYCNLDDGWQGTRGGVLNALQPNEKFGDMKRLFDEMHAEGLKAGIYSTPWGTSYQYLPGSSSDSDDGRWDGDTSRKTGWRVKKHMFDVQDIAQFAEWGCDYFKYDWAMGEKPHQPNLPQIYYAGRIAAIIASQRRDIVLELSNAAPFGEALNFTQLGNMTRTGSDLIDIWSHELGDGHTRHDGQDAALAAVQQAWTLEHAVSHARGDAWRMGQQAARADTTNQGRADYPHLALVSLELSYHHRLSDRSP